MAKTRQQKEELLGRLTEVASNANSIVFVGFRGLSVPETSAMRQELRGEGTSYEVAKKSLIRRAFGDSKIEGELPELPGEVALAYGDDPVAAARGVHGFAKKFKDNITILGGVFENRFMNQEEMMTIATIPPLQTLYGQFVGLINSPIQQFVVALDQIAEKKEA